MSSSGSSQNPGTGPTGNGSSGGPGSSGTPGASSGNPGSTSSSSSGGNTPPPGAAPQDAGQIDAAAVGATFTLKADAFTVAPGAEVYNCQIVANPFSTNVDLVYMEGKMSAGSHHFFLYNMDPLAAALYSKTLGPCPMGGIENHPFAFLSQQPDWTVQIPTKPDSTGQPTTEQMGYPVVKANSFMINVHYLNASSSPIQASVSITLKASKNPVTTHVGNIFLNDANLSVPAGTSTSHSSWSNNVGSAINLYASWSHMHKWGFGFAATVGSQQFYSETAWDEPALFWHLPGYTNPTTAKGSPSVVSVPANQSVSWGCQYNNTTGATLTFGESAGKNVMCIYVGQFYPANATAPDIIVPAPMIP